MSISSKRSSAAPPQAKRLAGDDSDRRRALHGQLDRLRDLYVLGDLTKNQYVMKRQAIEEELARHAPPIDPALAQAEALLDDFARFWDEDPHHAAAQQAPQGAGCQ